MGFFKNLFKSKEEKEKLKKQMIGLKQNKAYSFSELKNLLDKKKTVDESFLRELEEVLILSDFGIDYTNKYMESLRRRIKKEKISDVIKLKEILLEEFSELYPFNEINPLNKINDGLTVYLFMGINGSGKTTSIAKLAYKLKSEGKRVLIGAGDTFRAAALDQLLVWGERLKIDVVSGKENQDPSSVIFDAIKKAKAESYDYLLLDTAGRLQTKVNLMKELEKIYKVIGREVPGAPHETFLVIDATTGQNGLNQAKVFNESAKVTGLILTKLDGSSRGGVSLSASSNLNVPIKLYGCGEKENDIYEFNINEYLYSIFNDVLFNEEE